MQQETTHTRKGNTITDLNTKEVQKFEHINEAKRESRRIQGGALGQGKVAVLPRKGGRK